MNIHTKKFYITFHNLFQKTLIMRKYSILHANQKYTLVFKSKSGGNILQFGGIIVVNQGKNFSNSVDRDILVEVRLAHQYRPLQTIPIGHNLAVNMLDSGDLQDKLGDIDTTFSVSESMYIKCSPIVLSHNRGPGCLIFAKREGSRERVSRIQCKWVFSWEGRNCCNAV